MRSTMKTMSVLSCAAFALSASALAVPLPTGASVAVNGTTSGQHSWLPGTNTGGTLSSSFTIRDAQNNPVYQGTLVSSASISHELGTVRTRYRIDDMQAVGNRSIIAVEINGFGGLQTNVDYSLDGLGDTGPSVVQRNNTGVRLTYFFNSPALLPSDESRFFWVFTNGTGYSDLGQARIVLNTGESVVITGVRVPALTQCPGDTNGDGEVNFTDLNTVLSEFGGDCD